MAGVGGWASWTGRCLSGDRLAGCGGRTAVAAGAVDGGRAGKGFAASGTGGSVGSGSGAMASLDSAAGASSSGPSSTDPVATDAASGLAAGATDGRATGIRGAASGAGSAGMVAGGAAKCIGASSLGEAASGQVDVRSNLSVGATGAVPLSSTTACIGIRMLAIGSAGPCGTRKYSPAASSVRVCGSSGGAAVSFVGGACSKGGRLGSGDTPVRLSNAGLSTTGGSATVAGTADGKGSHG